LVVLNKFNFQPFDAINMCLFVSVLSCLEWYFDVIIIC
jgi:hypothetical protein